MSKSSFRIIAVRVLPECAQEIMRALCPNETYFLCNDYEDVYDDMDEWETIRRKISGGDRPPRDFFSIHDIEKASKRNNSPTVNISSVVGKNGDGKSSLVELMLRIINNFALAYGFGEDQETLTHVYGVDAILFYEINDVLYYIKCSQEKVDTSFAKPGRKAELKKHQECLFYTIVANYSIYAYNSMNFEREVKEGEECWINGLFHKKDSYQTPLSLNPRRTEGNFDVNKEEDLCRQRLMALYADLGDDPQARVINGTKIASGFAFNLEEISKLESVTLKSYFQTTWMSTELSLSTSNFEGYFKYLEDIDNASKYKEMARRDFEDQVSFWIQYGGFWDKYQSLFKLAERVNDQIYNDNSTAYNSKDTDLNMYLSVAKLAFEGLLEDTPKKKKLLDSLNKVESLSKKLTGLQFQRLVLIVDVCELWEKQPWFKKNDFAKAITKYVERKNNRGVEKCHALLYVVYKTIAIFSKNKGFVNLLDVDLRYFNLFDRVFEDGSEYYNRLPQCFNLLFEDQEQHSIVKKYDTLKLRQTINYLRYNSFRINRTIDPYTEHDFGYKRHVTFDRLQGFIKDAKKKCDEETIALLPPPIFVGDILIREGEERAGFPRFKMSDLSSGELQLLNSISTYIYHLRNLNYHTGSHDLIEYSYVNLILEEVELYFHPEYQRKYIYYLLKQIGQVKLHNIRAINIILVTHSPFVLTDIPKNNVLFLQEGHPTHVMQENTFGANIHALLQNGFFLEGAPIGEFAKEKINKMFERLHKGDYNEELFEEIRLVSEPLLKTQLYQLYSLNKLPHQNLQYEELLARVDKLEKQQNG